MKDQKTQQVGFLKAIQVIKEKKRYKNTSLKNASLLGAKNTFGNNNYMRRQTHAAHHQHLYLGTCMRQLNPRQISGCRCDNGE